MRRDDPDVNLFELFHEQALSTPDAIAIVRESRSLTYRELLELSQRIAQGLRTLALAPEEPVGLCISRNETMIGAMLAILAVGSAYVPIDPDNPPQRLRRIAENARCRIVLADRAALDQLGSHGSLFSDTRIVIIDTLLTTLDVRPDLAPERATGGDRRAYIIYTSGSTGIPKGVDITHRGVVNFLYGFRDLVAIRADDRVLAAATIGFDVSVVEIFLPLMVGASLLLRDRRIWLSPDQLADDIVRHRVTIVQASASTWSVLLAPTNRLPRLRVALNMGEAIPVALALHLVQVCDEAWNLYGPTEGSVYCAMHRLSGDATLQQMSGGKPSPIGWAIPNVSIHILDHTDKPVADDEIGELCVGGIAPARGYYDDPALTAQKFSVHQTLGERLYRTGDLASRSGSGMLSFHGRIDDQLKIRGMRIEPGEVEAALLGCPQVRAAAVTWYDNADGFRSLIAAVVAPDHDVQAIRKWLVPRLPAQMIPSRFLFLEVLPKGITGKVDRLAIRARADEALSESDGAPTNRAGATQASLAAIWREILRVPQVRADDHFFELGGDSLAAVRVTQAIESKFGLTLPIHVVFEAPVLARLASRLDMALAGASGGDVASFVFPLVPSDSSFPLFFNEVDLRLAKSSAWTAPCAMYAVSHWARGAAFTGAQSLIEVAGAQWAAIRKIQPSGPYRLAGYSFGALVAYETAQQMRREGQEVELLFLLDPMIPSESSRVAGAIPLQLFNHRAGKWLLYSTSHRLKPSEVSNALFPVAQRHQLWFSIQRLVTRYKPAAYTGPVHAVFSDPARRAAWQSILGRITPMPLIDTAGRTMFDEPALTHWLSDLSERIEALD